MCAYVPCPKYTAERHLESDTAVIKIQRALGLMKLTQYTHKIGIHTETSNTAPYTVHPVQGVKKERMHAERCAFTQAIVLASRRS